MHEDETVTSDEQPQGRTRRGLLLAGAAGVAAAAVLGESTPAAATSGGGDQGFLQMGSNSWFRAPSTFSNTPNVASVATDIVASANYANYTTIAGYYVFRADARPAGNTFVDGLHGYGTGGGSGVYGQSSGDGSYGVYGLASIGVVGTGSGTEGLGAEFRGARAAIRLGPRSVVGAPTTGPHDRGELVVDNAGVLWLCKTSGTPGTWVQVSEQSVTGGTPPPAGPSFQTLPTPERFIDTRSNLGGVQGPVAAGTTSTFQMTGRNGESGNAALQVPASATAIVGNLSVIGSAGAPIGSFVTMWPSGDRPTTSSISFGPGSIVANAYTCGLGAGDGGQKIITVFAQQTCDYIVDVVGFFG